VSLLYTAPTAIRSLQSFGPEWVKKYSRESLRILGSVGEPINPEAWLWYHDVRPPGPRPAACLAGAAAQCSVIDCARPASLEIVALWAPGVQSAAGSRKGSLVWS